MAEHSTCPCMPFGMSQGQPWPRVGKAHGLAMSWPQAAQLGWGMGLVILPGARVWPACLELGPGQLAWGLGRFCAPRSGHFRQKGP